MGQQQLLLLVLGIVIVGLAVVVGIAAFSENQTTSSRDAANADAVRLLSEVHEYLSTPEQMGGGQGLGTIPTVADLGYETNSDNNYVNANGVYWVSPGGENGFYVGGCTRQGYYFNLVAEEGDIEDLEPFTWRLDELCDGIEF